MRRHWKPKARDPLVQRGSHHDFNDDDHDFNDDDHGGDDEDGGDHNDDGEDYGEEEKLIHLW